MGALSRENTTKRLQNAIGHKLDELRAGGIPIIWVSGGVVEVENPGQTSVAVIDIDNINDVEFEDHSRDTVVNNEVPEEWYWEQVDLQ